MEGGLRRKEQNEERIMDRGRTERHKESEREDRKDRYSLYSESQESADHGTQSRCRKTAKYTASFHILSPSVQEKKRERGS